MSRIDELIGKLCPGGVDFRELRELASYTRGLTYGKNDEQPNGPIRVLRSNNITLSTNTVNLDDVKTVSDSVRVREDQWLRGEDILISAASGSKAHVGKVAYIREDIEYCFGGFMAVLRTYGQIHSRFLFHLLIGRTFNEYLGSALATTTINNLNASIMNAFKVPVPPMAVQLEIVKVLDNFRELEANLEAELEAEKEARRRQYRYYRDALLSPAALASEQASPHMQWRTLGELGTFIRGRRFTNKDFVEAGVGCIHYGEIYTHYGLFATRTRSFLRPALAATLRMAKQGDLIIAGTGENVEEVCKAVAWLGADEVAVHDDCYIFSHSLNPKYAAYFFESSHFNEQKVRYAAGAKMTRVSSDSLKKIRMPVPSMLRQDRIVAILDKLDALVNDLSIGLPAELKARRQQYEYYRDRLLSFREAA